MAEARASVNSIRLGTVHLEAVSTRAKLRGPQAASLDGGFIIVVPAPKYLLKQLSNKLRHLWNNLRHAAWPMPIWGVFGGVGAFVSQVLVSPSDSWFRNNQLANVLWDYDVRIVNALGVGQILPVWFRVIYIAFNTSLGVLLSLSFVNRFGMRILLSYHGWMVEKKPSMLTMAWGAMMKFAFALDRHPLTFTYQGAMPRLAVPPLKLTIDRWLTSIKPVTSDAEYAEFETAARDFMNNGGKKLQAILVAKSFFSTNYVSDWWEKYVYLRGRSPILINSNYYGLGFAGYIPTDMQTSRAATLVHQYMRFKQLLDAEKLTPMSVRGVVPICMRQYERLFQTTRIPGRDADQNVHLDPTDSIHIAVLYRGAFWKVNVLSEDGTILAAHELEEQFDKITSLTTPPKKDSALACLPALTGQDRSVWAEHRETFFQEGINKESLDEIENSIFVLHLDDRKPVTWTECGNLCLHGEGTTRWCDKSFNLVVFANGQAGVHAEHSWADAPVIAHAWEWVLANEFKAAAYTDGGRCKQKATAAPPPGSPKRGRTQLTAADRAREPIYLEFDLSQKACEAILAAKAHCEDLCKDLDLIVDCCDTKKGLYGKGFMKKQKMSPDAWIQMCLQLAWHRDQGKFSLTYEAAAVRLFNEGRTETIRSCTSETRHFVTLMDDPKVSKEEKIKAMRNAASRHVSVSRESSIGRGVDRHLFCLYVASLGVGMDIKFLKDALSMPWQLSTSQIPQRQTEGEWPKEVKEGMFSPSGGFGPVSDQGYGVSYMMATDDVTFFHISSKRSCKATDSEKFRNAIWKAHEDMRALFD